MAQSMLLALKVEQQNEEVERDSEVSARRTARPDAPTGNGFVAGSVRFEKN